MGAEFCEDAERGLLSRDEGAWVARVDAELSNVRGAWHRAVEDGRLDVAARITVALGEFAFHRSRSELWEQARALAAHPGLERSPLAAAVLGEAAHSAWLQGELAEAERFATRGLELADPGDPSLWRCWESMGMVLTFSNDFPAAERAFLRAVDELRLGPQEAAAARALAARPRLYRGDIEGARALVALARPAADAAGRLSLMAAVRCVQGEVEMAADPAGALAPLREAIELARPVGAVFLEQVAAMTLLDVYDRLGDRAAALALYPGLLRHWERSGHRLQQWMLHGLAGVLAGLGRLEDTAVLLAAAGAITGPAPMTAGDADRLRTLDARAAEALGADAYARARAAGAALTPAGMLDFARAAIARATA